MSSIEVLPASPAATNGRRSRASHGLDVIADLEPLIRRRVTSPAKRAGQVLPVAGVSRRPDRPFYHPTPRGTWYYAASYLDDPTLAEVGAIPVPRSEHTKLVALRDAGVAVDAVWLAHELPTHWSPGAPLPSLVPAPPSLRALDEALVGLIEGAVSVAAWALGAAAGAATSSGWRLSSGRSWYEEFDGGDALDPVVLGGVFHPRLDVVVWFRLAEWRW